MRINFVTERERDTLYYVRKYIDIDLIQEERRGISILKYLKYTTHRIGINRAPCVLLVARLI